MSGKSKPLARKRRDEVSFCSVYLLTINNIELGKSGGMECRIRSRH